MDGQNDATPTNPYMALRAAKIARNQARLKELGLCKPERKSVVLGSRKRGTVTKHKKHNEVVLAAAAAASRPTRRSARISGLPSNPNYVESKDFKDLSKRVSGIDQQSEYDAEERKIPAKSSKPSRQHTASAPVANSVRTVSLNVSMLVRKFLAKPMDTFGKYFVIETSFQEAAFPEDLERLNGVSRLSFNKFSGVQPWKNVIFLWINIGGPTDANSLINDFSDNGSRVAWFGGSRMTEDSSVIQDLIRMGKEALSTALEPSLSSGIILWCRQYNWKTNKFLPYTCLGRLAYESHVLGSYPVSFTWRLIDHEVMLADDSKHKVFREISGSDQDNR